MSKKKSTTNSKGFKPAASSAVPVESTTGEQAVVPANEDIDADAIFRKYNISNGESAVKKLKPKKQEYDENAPFGRDTITNIPFAQQAKIENTLISAVFVSLSFVILCGIAISFGAFRVVFPDIVITSEFDEIIKSFLTPAFTPALGFFFLCSTTFGLFKFAQISNAQSVYRE